MQGFAFLIRIQYLLLGYSFFILTIQKDMQNESIKCQSLHFSNIKKEVYLLQTAVIYKLN